MKDSKGLQDAIAHLKGEKIIKTQKDVVTKTGYTKGTVSAYVSGNSTPSPDFIEKFENVFKLSLNDFGNDTENSNHKNEADYSMKAIYNLTETNKVAVDNCARLIALLEKKEATVNVSPEKTPALQSILDGFLEALSVVAARKEPWHTPQEAARALSRIIYQEKQKQEV